jgi:hypothetical protein
MAWLHKTEMMVMRRRDFGIGALDRVRYSRFAGAQVGRGARHLREPERRRQWIDRAAAVTGGCAPRGSSDLTWPGLVREAHGLMQLLRDQNRVNDSIGLSRFSTKLWSR